MTMAATVIPQLPLCPTPGAAAYNNQLEVKYSNGGNRTINEGNSMYYWFEKIKLIKSCEQLDKLLIESANGVIIIIMNIMCFDAFGDLIEHILRPLSWCSFICDIQTIENQ
jgi:hypothetical protein